VKKCTFLNVKTVKGVVTKVLVLVLAIIFKSSIGIGIGNTFCSYRKCIKMFPWLLCKKISEFDGANGIRALKA